MQTSEQTQNFSFQSQELFKKLLDPAFLYSNGYWKLGFSRLLTRKEPTYVYLGITDPGTISYSGTQPWSSRELLQISHRYILQARHEKLKPHIARWKADIIQQSMTSHAIVEQMHQLGISKTQLRDALRSKLLNDFDLFLMLGSGEAQFIPDASLHDQLPIPGFGLSELLNESLKRQALWRKLRLFIPSMDMLPILDNASLDAANLPQAQRQWIEKILKHKRSLNQISVGLAKDPLEIARLFTKWLQAGLLSLEPQSQAKAKTVMIIDDSPLVLKQFQSLVSALGYQVQVCQQAETALHNIAHIRPAIVFIDINMPGLTGFELVKQIRQQTQLATIPLVILTGEQKLSNKWRAQWSGCEFLTKPLASNEIHQFQLQLQELIQMLVMNPSVMASAS